MAIKQGQQQLEDGWRLSPKQARFVAEYLKDLNATQAAVRAGYSKAWANKNAHRLTVSDGIRQAIVAARDEFYKGQHMNAAEAFAITSEMARVNYRQFFDAQGNLLPPGEWSEAMGLALSGLEVIIKNAQAGDGVTDTVHKLRLVDRTRVLDMVHRINGSYAADKLEVTDGDQVAARLNAARKRLAQRGKA